MYVFNVWGKLKKYHKFSKYDLCLLEFFQIYFLCTGIISTLFYNIFINNVLINKNLKYMIVVILGFLGVFFIETIGRIFNKRLYNKIFINMKLVLRKKILKKYLNLDSVEANLYSIGDIANRLDEDLDKFEIFIYNKYFENVITIVSVITYGCILLNINIILSIISFIIIPSTIILGKIFEGKTRYYGNKYREKKSEYESFIYYSIKNWKEIRTNNIYSSEVEKSKKILDELTPFTFKLKLVEYLNGLVIAFNDLILIQILIYILGGILVIQNQIKVDNLLIFINYYSIFINHIKKVSQCNIELNNGRSSVDRIFEILNFKNDKELFQDTNKYDVELINVDYKYNEEGNKVLSDISINIKENEFVAIIGESGCGKSTLLKLISGIYNPLNGKILIGNKNIKNKKLHKKLSFVMQEPFFFNLSIIENLRIVKPNASYKEIVEVCKISNVYNIISNMPNGFDTIIGENGSKLSGGELQLLALARVILQGTKIIILDEVTSALDNHHEELVLTTLKYLSKNHTIILISHRTSSISSANRVIKI